MAKENPKAPAQAPQAEAKVSAEGESAPSAGKAPAAPKPAARFRVWAHGALHCDGVVFAPGEELPLTEAQVETLALGQVAVRIED
jgi:hypothetical protein